MRKIELVFIIVCLLVISFLASGCVETQKVWGKGELPADWVAMFGDDNPSRLNKAQNDMLNRHEVLILGLDQVKDGKETHLAGLVDYVNILNARLTALEAVDPNALLPRIGKLERLTRFMSEHDPNPADALKENNYKWDTRSPREMGAEMKVTE